MGASVLNVLINKTDEDLEALANGAEQHFLGYGICNRFFEDINYYYAICSRSITIYNCINDWEHWKREDWKALAVIELPMSEKDIENVVKYISQKLKED